MRPRRARVSAARDAALGSGAVHLALALAVALLSFPRLLTGAWFEQHLPIWGVLLEGWPAEWETQYYVPHLPSFLQDAQPAQGFSAVHMRVFLPLFLASMLYGWGGNAYWALASVDLLYWYAASVASYHLPRAFGASQTAALATAALVVASPLFVSNLWSQVLHSANFASMALGLWAAVALVMARMGRVRLIFGLGVLLLWLSVTYNYHWLVVPVVFLLAAWRYGWRASLVTVSGAVALLLAGTLSVHGAFEAAGLFREPAYPNAVADPARLLARQVTSLDAPSSILSSLPTHDDLVETITAYHPLVLGAAMVGMVAVPARVRVLTLVASALTLAATHLYQTPGTSMSAYPLVYYCAGEACSTLSRGAARLARRQSASMGRWIGRGIALLSVLSLVLLTNRDLLGDPSFALVWWDRFTPRPLF